MDRLILLAGTLCCAGLMVGAAMLGDWYIPLAIGLGIATVVLALRFPSFHFGVFFLLMGYHFHAIEEGVSVIDVLLAVYFATVLVGWFIWTIGIRQEILIWEWKDIVLILVLMGSVFGAALSLSHDRGSLLAWAREWALVAMIAYYFVFRSVFASKAMFHYYAVLLILVTIILSVWGIVTFREQVFRSLFAYQLRGARLGTTPYLLGLVLALSLYLFEQLWRRRAIWLLCCAIITAGIVATYTRTLWLTTIAILAMLILLVPWKQKIRAIWIIGVVSVGIIGIAEFSMGQILPVVRKLVTVRLSSVQRGINDPALRERRDETQRLVRHLTHNPEIAITGYGFGRRYTFYDTFLGAPAYVLFVHNGLLSLLFKMGIPLGLTLYLFHLLMVAKSIRCYWRSRSTEYEPYMLSFTLALLAATVIDMTANNFVSRSGALFLAMLYAGIAIADRLVQQERDGAREQQAIS